VSLFLLGALRAIVEMLGLCLLAQVILYLLAGPRRANNAIYQLFALITRQPRRLVARMLPAHATSKTVAIATFFLLLCLWIGLALARKFI